MVCAGLQSVLVSCLARAPVRPVEVLALRDVTVPRRVTGRLPLTRRESGSGRRTFFGRVRGRGAGVGAAARGFRGGGREKTPGRVRAPQTRDPRRGGGRRALAVTVYVIQRKEKHVGFKDSEFNVPDWKPRGRTMAGETCENNMVPLGVGLTW